MRAVVSGASFGAATRCADCLGRGQTVRAGKDLNMHGVQGQVVAAFFDERMKDVRGPFAPRTARRNVGDPGASGRVAWRPQCCGGRWPNSCCGKRKTKGWGRLRR